jgi:hypothetical protein
MTTSSDDPILRFEEAFAKVAESHGLTREVIGQVNGDDLVFWTRAARRGPGTSVFLSSGIHGDEPCGPLAMLEFLRSDPLPDDCEWVIAPLLNPSGLRAGTRGNAEGIDLNRDFYRLRSEEVNAVTDWWSRQHPRNLVHLSLHEDWEAEGFYLYEINSGGRDPLGSRVVERISSQFPIQAHGPVDDHELSGPGLILHAPEPDDLEGWPEAIWLAKHHPVLSLTFEAPGTYGTRLRRTGLMAALAATVRRVSGSRHRRAA